MFLFRLSLELGVPHPDYLLEILSPWQLDDWATYYGEEPWGHDAQNNRAALIAATVANFAGKVSKKQFKPSDFLPRKPLTVAQRIRKAFGVPEKIHGKAR